LENGVLEIRASSASHVRYLRQNATEAFTQSAQAVTGHLVGVHFVAAGSNSADPAPNELTAESSGHPSFKEDYVFDSFVVGPCNRLAHAACVAVSESPGQAYNPLFLHGSVGLGKTHLLQAVGHEVIRQQPAAKVLFLTCETFIRHFIQGVENGDLHNFRYRYRHVDVIMIDDIHFLADRESSQEEFFHTFNTLYQAHKQIILTADSAPSQIPSLEQRLTSRFNWGLVARIDRPSYETRVAIVHKKAHLRGLAVPDDVICLIATKVDTNTRELEGALTKVVGWAAINGGTITLELAKQALADPDTAQTREVSIEQIFDAITARFNVRLADLQGKKRTKSIVYPRQVCMHLARHLTRHSLEEIGGYFGGRDHTTVLHAVRTIDQHRRHDAHLQALLEEVCRSFRVADLDRTKYTTEVPQQPVS
jgi:chromosomal replication initiator protein